MKLTLEQQKLVEENHNLIYGFASKNNLDLDKFYDILAISLCKAVSKYNPEKGKLSTFVYKAMRNDVNQYFRSEMAKKRKPDEPIKVYDESFDDMEPVNKGLDIHTKLMIESLTEDEQKVIKARIGGLSKYAIHKTLGFSTPFINRSLEKLKSILKGDFSD